MISDNNNTSDSFMDVDETKQTDESKHNSLERLAVLKKSWETLEKFASETKLATNIVRSDINMDVEVTANDQLQQIPHGILLNSSETHSNLTALGVVNGTRVHK